MESFAFLIRALVIGGIIGGLVRLGGATTQQSILVGGWMTIGALYVQQFAHQRSPYRADGVAFGLMLTAYGLLLMLPTFGYESHPAVIFGLFGVALGMMLIERRIRRPRLQYTLYATLALGFVGLIAFFLGPCAFQACSPRSWEDQRTFVQEQLAARGPEWALDRMLVEPARENRFWFATQPALEVSMSLIRTRPTPDATDAALPYQTAGLYFNDIDPARTLAAYSTAGWANSLAFVIPDATLEQIRIGPRDAFAATEEERRRIFGSPQLGPGMRVTFEQRPPEGIDTPAPPLWRVTYINLDADRGMTIWVDARTGAIVRTEAS